MEIHLTIVDFVVLGILMISGMIAWHRGFMKETLTVSAWLVAALAAVFFWPATKPFAQSLVEPKIVADILALLGVFLLALIPTSFVSFRLTELVRDSRAGPLDRSLGFVFGIARGMLVVGAGYLVFASLAPAKTQPEWVREARLLPVVKGTADMLLSLGAKKNKAGKKETAIKLEAEENQEAKPAANNAKTAKKQKAAEATDTSNNEGGGGDEGTSYDAGDRRALDRLVKSTTKE
jgi:membrane protein required for colicin V production